MKVVDYFDVTLNLSNGEFFPYRKPDNQPLYIKVPSNHPPSIIKQLPATISSIISSLSCDHDEFDKAAPMYKKANNALWISGFPEQITFSKLEAARKKKKKGSETSCSSTHRIAAT